jgi:ethanolamine ammonia-lyase small subunit
MTEDRPPANNSDAAWRALSELTPARIALGRSGHSLPTREVLAFTLAHARARDAVHNDLDVESLRESLSVFTRDVLVLESAAGLGRDRYLLRPDLGRMLSKPNRDQLDARASEDIDVLIVVADGLSSAAVQRHAAPLLTELKPWLRNFRLGPLVIARGARVALGDEIGQRLRARMVVVLIGERPGLSSPDSLGVYLTFAPVVGRLDSERNCISNIHAAGSSYVDAARRLGWLIERAFALSLTGVGLKDESGRSSLPKPA